MKSTVFTVIAVLLLLATVQFAVGDFTIHNYWDTDVYVSYAYYDETYSGQGAEGAWRVTGMHKFETGKSGRLVGFSGRVFLRMYLYDEENGIFELLDSSRPYEGPRRRSSIFYHDLSMVHNLVVRFARYDESDARELKGPFDITVARISHRRDILESSSPIESLIDGWYYGYPNGGSLTINGDGSFTGASAPPAQVQEPTWEFQRSFHPHADSYSGSIRDIGFRGNSQVFFGKGERLYKWDMSARRYWWITHRSSYYKIVEHVEVSESHDIVANTFGDNLYLRRASDLSLIDSVVLPGDGPDTLSMGPRTNYLIVSGDSSTEETIEYARIYDLWENDSWGLNRRPHDNEQGYRLAHVDILNYDYAYGVRDSRVAISELRFRESASVTLDFFPGLSNFVGFEAVAAGQTSNGGVRIAGISRLYRLIVWDWHANLLYSHKFSRGTGRSPRSFQFTPNREILTWIDDWADRIVFWDVTTRGVDAVVNLEETTDFICHAFSNDGKTMAVGTGDGAVHIYKWSGVNAPAAPAQKTELSQPTALLANYPNPFNPETWIPYQLSEPAEVSVSIYSVDGKLVRTLELGQMPSGVYSDKERAAYWDGRNAAGEPVASGVYFYTLRAGDFKATRKMVIRK